MHQIKKTKKHKKPWSKQGTKPQNDFGKNNQGLKNNNRQQSQGKCKQPPSETAMPAPKKHFHGHGQQTTKTDPSTCMRCGDTRHQPGFSCPTANINAKLAARLATSLPDASQNLKQLTNNSRRGIGIPQCLAR